jgi:pimeloyl-ACP methyl ester carboxylesterase
MQTRIVETDGLTQQVLEDGPEGGPLVLLIHGFPELGLSWRAQVKALGEAGYRAVAPDMRGYGGTDKPGRTEEHTILHLVGDMVDLVRALGRSECTVVGHDWGAPVAWHCALMRPDLFTAVAGLSVPFQPRRPGGPPTPAMAALARRAGKGELYMNQFQAPDAHRIFEAGEDGAAHGMRRAPRLLLGRAREGARTGGARDGAASSALRARNSAGAVARSVQARMLIEGVGRQTAHLMREVIGGHQRSWELIEGRQAAHREQFGRGALPNGLLAQQVLEALRLDARAAGGQ